MSVPHGAAEGSPEEREPPRPGGPAHQGLHPALSDKPVLEWSPEDWARWVEGMPPSTGVEVSPPAEEADGPPTEVLRGEPVPVPVGAPEPSVQTEFVTPDVEIDVTDVPPPDPDTSPPAGDEVPVAEGGAPEPPEPAGEAEPPEPLWEATGTDAETTPSSAQPTNPLAQPPEPLWDEATSSDAPSPEAERPEPAAVAPERTAAGELFEEYAAPAPEADEDALLPEEAAEAPPEPLAGVDVEPPPFAEPPAPAALPWWEARPAPPPPPPDLDLRRDAAAAEALAGLTPPSPPSTRPAAPRVPGLAPRAPGAGPLPAPARPAPVYVERPHRVRSAFGLLGVAVLVGAVVAGLITVAIFAISVALRRAVG